MKNVSYVIKSEVLQKADIASKLLGVSEPVDKTTQSTGLSSLFSPYTP